MSIRKKRLNEPAQGRLIGTRGTAEPVKDTVRCAPKIELSLTNSAARQILDWQRGQHQFIG